MKPDLRTMFPKGSKSFFDANAADIPTEETKDIVKIRTPKPPTKTEEEFGRILQSQKRKGQLARYEFHGITLRWLEFRYTPDFLVVKTIPIECESCGKAHTRLQTYLRIIEVKGGHIFPGAIRRFKDARAHWPEFQFEMWQKKAGNWSRIF